MVRGQIGQLTDPLHNIGKMAKGVFQVLRRIVSHLGKGAEGCHIDKGVPVDSAHVNGPGLAPGGHHGRFHHTRRQAQIVRAVIGGPCRHIAQHGRRGQFHQTGHRFAQRSVPSGTDHPVKLSTQFPGYPGSIPFALGRIDSHQPPGLCKTVEHQGKLLLHRALARRLIVNKQHPFHAAPPPKLCFHYISARGKCKRTA